MNNANPPTVTGNPTLDALLGKLVQSGAATQQQVQPIQQATDYYAKTNADIANTARGDLNGVNGYAVNAGVPIQAWDKNTAVTAGIPLQLAENLNTNSTSLLSNLLNNATSQANNTRDNYTTQRGQSLQYGENDPNGGGVNGTDVNGMTAVNEVNKQGGSSLLNGLSQPEQYSIAQQILAAGGVSKYLHSNPNAAQLHPEDLRVLSNLNNGLSLGYDAYAQLDKSKALQNIFDSTTKKTIAQVAIEAGHPEWLKTAFGLTDNDITALRNMESLSKNSIAGGAGISLGLNNTSGGNIAALKKLNQLTYNQAKSLANHYGYSGPEDIPGFSSLGGQ